MERKKGEGVVVLVSAQGNMTDELLKEKGKEMNRKNMKKLLFAAIAVVIVAKVVRDTKNAKKQKENIPADTFNDFYEEELNWWDKDLK